MSLPALRVVLVEDHDLLAMAIQEAFQDVPDIAIVARAASIENAVAAVRAWQPDVVLLDRMLPDGDGVAAITRLRTAAPTAAVLVMTADAPPTLAARVVAAGGHGLVLKSHRIEDLVAGIERAAASR